MTEKQKNLHWLVESAILIAIAVVLELLSKLIIPSLPFGGQITIVSMLPVVLISYRFGMKRGFVSCLAYAFIEMALGAKNVSGAFQNPEYFGGDEVVLFNAFLMCLLDYLVAFTVLDLGGLFRNKIKNPGVSLMTGSIVALGCRYLTHFCSGFILFRGFAEWYFTQDTFPAWGAALVENVSPTALGVLYSLIYNGFYMIPEIILTAIASLLIAKIPGVVKKVC